MSSVIDSITCPQCAYTQATLDFDCRTGEEETSCRRCGYYESWTAKRDQDGKPRGWTHEINRGFGALVLRIGGNARSPSSNFMTKAEIIAQTLRAMNRSRLNASPRTATSRMRKNS
jgi:hypothetical protein